VEEMGTLVEKIEDRALALFLFNLRARIEPLGCLLCEAPKWKSTQALKCAEKEVLVNKQ
jgi:hypothetical protein